MHVWRFMEQLETGKEYVDARYLEISVCLYAPTAGRFLAGFLFYLPLVYLLCVRTLIREWKTKKLPVVRAVHVCIWYAHGILYKM